MPDTSAEFELATKIIQLRAIRRYAKHDTIQEARCVAEIKLLSASLTEDQWNIIVGIADAKGD